MALTAKNMPYKHRFGPFAGENLYLRVGPDETYWEPCNQKGGFHLTFARINGALDGQVMAFFVMVVAAAEVVVGLAIIVSIYRRRRTIVELLSAIPGVQCPTPRGAGTPRNVGDGAGATCAFVSGDGAPTPFVRCAWLMPGSLRSRPVCGGCW